METNHLFDTTTVPKVRSAARIRELKFLVLQLAALAVITIANAICAQTSPYDDPTTVSAIPDTNNSVPITGTATERVEPDRVMAIFSVEMVD